MLSVSCRDTDNTDHTDKTITRAGAGLDWGSASGLESQSEQAQEWGCRSDLERAWEPDSVLGLGLGLVQALASDLASDSDSVFDSVPASVALE